MKRKADSNIKNKATRVRVADVLTKTVLETAARKGIQQAAEETIEVMGFNVIARNGWIVREFPNNRIERISQIPRRIQSK